MLEKYRATIHGDTISWEGDVPSEIRDGKSIDVVITLVEEPILKSKADTRRAIAALQAIADRGGIKSIPDPDKWLRDVRKDRPLHGRQ